jgi:uncharacterized RDD family membrane protein YckC
MRARDPNRGREIMVEVAAKAVDRALAGPLPEALASSIVKHDVVERVAAQMLEAADAGKLELEETERLARRIVASPAFQRMLIDALDSQLTPELMERLLQNPETERFVESVVSSPAVRAALARQTTSLADEMAAGIRRRTVGLDEAAERVVRGQRGVSNGKAPYAGIATRGVAFVVDLAITQVVFLAGAAMLGLLTSLVGELRPSWLANTLAAFGWTLLVGTYFVLFWTVAGQTPGMRLMRLRVAGAVGAPPQLGRSLLRFVGLLLAIVPLFAGFLPVLFDARRRGLHDFFARTVVIHDPEG